MVYLRTILVDPNDEEKQLRLHAEFRMYANRIFYLAIHNSTASAVYHEYTPDTKDVQPFGCCVSVATPLTRS